MGLLVFGALTYFILMTTWAAIKSKEERAKLVKEFQDKPGQCLFVIVWLGCIYLFVIGIFVPILGEKKVFHTSWPIWQIGGIGSSIGLVISWLWPKN